MESLDDLTDGPARILIVEDEILLAKDLASSLKNLGYEITGRVSSAEEAIQIVEESNPDLILMDIKLEGEMDGIEAADQIRTRFDMPVVYLTAFPEKDALERAKATEPYGYLGKPISQLELRSTIETALYKHEADKRVREGEEKYKNLFHGSNDAIFIHDLEADIIDANRRVQEMFGYSEEEILALRVPDLHPKEALPICHQQFENIARDGYVCLEVDFVRKNGEVFIAEVSSSLFEFSGRKIVQGIVRDITDRKKAEEALKARVHQQAAVADLGQSALAGAEPSTLMDEAVEKVAQALEVEYSKILELLPNGTELLLRAGVGWTEGLIGHTTVGAGNDSQAGYTLLSSEPVIVEDLCTESRFSLPPLLQDHRVVSGMSVIIQGRERPFGVLGAHTTESRQFAEDDVNFLQSVANVLAQAIERTRAEEELRESQERYRQLSEVTFEGIVFHDQGIILDANRQYCEMHGYSLGELKGKQALSLAVAPESMELVRRQIESRSHEPYEAIGLKKDGTKFPIEVQVRSRDFEGRQISNVAIRDITERKQAEEALREKEEMLETILATSPVGIGLTVDRRIKWVNKAWTKMFGLGHPDDYLGQDARILYPSKEEYERVGEALHADLAVGKLRETDALFRRKDGSHFRAHMRMKAIYASDLSKGTVAVITDISERMKAVEALQESEAQKQAILDGITTNIAFVNENLEILWVNKAAADSAAKLPSDMIGHKCHEFWGDSEKPCDGCPTVRAFETKSSEHKTRLASDGRVREHNAEPVFASNGRLLGVVEIAHDIAEKQKAQEIMVQNVKFKAVADLASGVAHNFNNLLQIVLGNASLAVMNLELGDFSNIRANLEEIIKSSRFGAETVRRLNSFAKAGAADILDEPEVCDLSDIVRQAVQMTTAWWKTSPEKRGISVNLKLDLQDETFVRGHKGKVFEVLVNLIKNAAEAVSDKGGDIKIVTSLQGEQVGLTVQDSGVGISEANMSRLFTPFFTTKFEAGTGLGLATSRQIVNQHGGHILVDSIEGEGTTVTVDLPLAQELPRPAELPEKTDGVKHLTVLAIDDMEAAVRMFRAGLERLCHTALTALSGQEGLAIFSETTPDVVVCDLGMPEMNGWQVAKAIKEMCEERGIPKTPFIILTGWGGQPGEEHKMAENGVDAVVEKPVDMPKLLEVINEVIQKK